MRNLNGHTGHVPSLACWCWIMVQYSATMHFDEVLVLFSFDAEKAS